MKQLREQEDKRRREELQQEQLAERLGIEEAHMAELREFNALWDAKVRGRYNTTTQHTTTH